MPAKPKTPKSPRGKQAPAKSPLKEEPAKAAPVKKQAGPREAKYDEFSVSKDVVWGLTKKWNSHIVKFNHNQWSKSPLSLTGFHCASESANTVGVTGTKQKTDKDTVRRVFTLTLKHKRKNGIAKRKQNSQSKPCYSVHEVRNEVNRTAKAIQNLTWVDAQEKKRALKRLAKASWSMGPTPKGGAAKSD